MTIILVIPSVLNFQMKNLISLYISIFKDFFEELRKGSTWVEFDPLNLFHRFCIQHDSNSQSMNTFENLGTHSFAYLHTCENVFESQHNLLAQFPHHVLNLVMESKNIRVMTTNQSVKNLTRDGYE
jgi:hypothetical protein